VYLVFPSEKCHCQRMYRCVSPSLKMMLGKAE
jgi:hypothetical protein